MTMRVLSILLVVGCVDEPTTGLSANDLGIATLQSSQALEEGNRIYTLRGLDADGAEIASVRLKSGWIAEASELPPAELDVATVIDLSAVDSRLRVLTRETGHINIDAGHLEPAIARFLALPEVSETLGREANLFVTVAAGETAYTDSYYAGTCGADQLLTSPIARICCSDTTFHNSATMNDASKTLFALDNEVVSLRTRNMGTFGQLGPSCVAADGHSACSGAACYFGPFGYAKPVLYQPTTSLRLQGKCITGKWTLGTQLTIETCGSTGLQNWTAISGGRVMNADTGTCAAVDSSGWARVVMATCSTSPTQVWSARGYMMASPYAGGQVMTTASGVVDDGWGIITKPFGSPAAYFTVNFTYAYESYQTSATGCYYNYYLQEYATQFADVTGNKPRNQGCPGGANGYGLWDY